MLKIASKNISNKITLVVLAACLTVSLPSCFKEMDVEQISQPTGIIQISPSSGPKNTLVNISGTNFPDKSGITVKVNGKSIPVVASTGNNIQIQIPAGTGSGKVEVGFGGATYDAGTFTYENSYTVTTLTGGTAGHVDGPLATAQFEDIESTTIDNNDNLYVADFSGSNNLRKVNLTTGQVTTLATLTPGGGAEFLTTDAAGNVFVADQAVRKIMKVTPGGAVTTVVTVPFKTQGVAVGTSGNIYVSGSRDIAKYSPAGTQLWRLTSHGTGNVDGDTSQVKFNLYGNLQIDPTETKLYFVNTPTQIKQLDLTAMKVSTIAGSTTAGFSDGEAIDAEFAFIYSITLDKTGGFYIADSDNGAIRYLKGGQVKTIIGGNGSGDVEGVGTTVKFGYPQHVSVDSKGNLYVADYTNLKIYKVVVD